MSEPAFYARTGTPGRDLLTLLHLPYTLWHLSYVAIGASLAAAVDWPRLGGTVAAFALGLGIGAHALDERHDRPLGTGLSDRWLTVLAVGSFLGVAAVSIAGAVVISPWVLAWAAAGITIAVGYAIEWPPLLHTDLGFALAWGAFPVIVGYWAQTESVGLAALVVAGAAALLSAAQRALSTPARQVRRRTTTARATLDDTEWDRAMLLATWEQPLTYLVWAIVILAGGLLLTKV